MNDMPRVGDVVFQKRTGRHAVVTKVRPPDPTRMDACANGYVVAESKTPDEDGWTEWSVNLSDVPEFFDFLPACVTLLQDFPLPDGRCLPVGTLVATYTGSAAFITWLLEDKSRWA